VWRKTGTSVKLGTLPVRVALDIDSTLYHAWDLFSETARRRFGVRLRYTEQIAWGIAELRPEQVRLLAQETHREEVIRSTQPYPGAVETVRAWHDAGHFIQVSSQRPLECHTATKEWLTSIGLPFDDVDFSGDKVSRCAAKGIDVLIDDSPLNLSRAMDLGITPAAIVHPWNREFCEDEGILCAEDWNGLRDVLAPLLEPKGEPATAR
jgi:uncharacterized protein